ncbi:hypothetical protein P5V15_005014 [Pogonomyrmex californicus]
MMRVQRRVKYYKYRIDIVRASWSKSMVSPEPRRIVFGKEANLSPPPSTSLSRYREVQECSATETRHLVPRVPRVSRFPVTSLLFSIFNNYIMRNFLFFLSSLRGKYRHLLLLFFFFF